MSIATLIGRGWAYLWTLTTADEVDLPELSRRWRRFIWNGFPSCVRVFERHPGGHGFHVHFVTPHRLDVAEIRPRAEAVGFGRINARRLPGAAAGYVAKYLTKQRGCRGVRMWAAVGFKGTRVKDAVSTDPHVLEIKMVMKRFPAPNGYNFWARWQLAERRHWWLWNQALEKGNDPNYRPPFEALYRKWRDDPGCPVGKTVPVSQPVVSSRNEF